MSREQQYQRDSRRRLPGKERRALMLQSAKRVFARSTYAEASTSKLACESEVSEPLLYKHFGCKKDLFLAVLREFGMQFLDLLQERISLRAEKNVLDALVHIVDEYYAIVKADPETQLILFQAIVESSNPEIARCVSEHYRTIYGLIRQLVVHAHQGCYLSPALNPDTATWGYMSMILTIQYILMLNLSDDVVQIQEEMSRIWLQGLRS